MNSFDASIIAFLKHFSHRSADFDYLVMLIGSNELIKGGVITALIWWAWFRPGENKNRDHEYLFYGILASFVAVPAARALADFLPFRERPFANPALHFQLPYHVDFLDHMIDWSSFPSDHAAMFFALATSIFSFRAGREFWRCCTQYSSYRCRGCMWGCTILRTSWRVRRWRGLCRVGENGGGTGKSSSAADALDREIPQTFYPVLFLLTFLITVIFNPVRRVALIFFKMLELVIRHLH